MTYAKENILELINGGRHLVPAYMWPGIERYFADRIEPGGFLMSLLSGASVMEVISKADDVNSDNLRNWCMFLYNYAPAGSYGSKEKVQSWLNDSKNN